MFPAVARSPAGVDVNLLSGDVTLDDQGPIGGPGDIHYRRQDDGTADQFVAEFIEQETRR